MAEQVLASALEVEMFGSGSQHVLGSTGNEPHRLQLGAFRPPVVRSRFASWGAAFWGVRAGLPLNEYLRYRRAWYCRHLPQFTHPLPLLVTVECGDIVVKPNPHAGEHPLRRLLEDPAGVAGADDAGPDGGEFRFLQARSRSEVQQALRDLEQAEQEHGRTEARLNELTELVEERKEALQQEIGSGRAEVPATAGRSVAQRGRLELPSAGPLLGLCLLVAAAALFETWQFAIPFLNNTGVDTTALAEEWRRNRLGILLGIGFAASASIAVFALFERLFELVRGIYQGDTDRRRLAFQVAGAAFVALAAFLGAMAISGMRHGFGEAASRFVQTLDGQNSVGGGGHAASWAFMVLTLLVPLASAFLLDRVRRLWEQRSAIRAEQRAWDAAQEQVRAVRERHEELIRRAEAERGLVEQTRAAVRQLIRQLNARAQAVEQRMREEIEAERRYAVAFCHGLVAALEQDRFYFVREAHRCNKVHLLAALPRGESPGESNGDSRPDERPRAEARSLKLIETQPVSPGHELQASNPDGGEDWPSAAARRS